MVCDTEANPEICSHEEGNLNSGRWTFLMAASAMRFRLLCNLLVLPTSTVDCAGLRHVRNNVVSRGGLIMEIVGIRLGTTAGSFEDGRTARGILVTP